MIVTGAIILEQVPLLRVAVHPKRGLVFAFKTNGFGYNCRQARWDLSTVLDTFSGPNPGQVVVSGTLRFERTTCFLIPFCVDYPEEVKSHAAFRPQLRR